MKFTLLKEQFTQKFEIFQKEAGYLLIILQRQRALDWREREEKKVPLN